MKKTLPLTLLLCLAGCSSVPVASGGDAVLPINKPARTGTATPQQGTPAGGQTPVDAVAGSQAGGTSAGAHAPIPVAGGAAATIVPVPVAASSGGQYRSADGKLLATVPPGALTSNATVSVIRYDTSARSVNAGLVPGIQFKLDLGGASILPDQSITVTAPVDARFIDEIKKRDPNYAPAAYNLSQAADGTWMMTMAVHGAVSQTPAHGATASLEAGLAEFGSMPIIGASAAPNKRQLLRVSEDGDCASWYDVFGMVPHNWGEVYQLEASGTYSCGYIDSFVNTAWYDHITTDLLFHQEDACPNGTPRPSVETAPPAPAATETPPTPAPTPTPVPIVDIPAHAVWDSDDPAIAGKDAAGAVIHFDMPWSPAEGPQDLVADGAGRASTFNAEGIRFIVTASTTAGPAAGSSVVRTATSGMAAVELRCPKYSPHVTFHLTANSPLPGKAVVHYTLDGAARTQEVAIPGGAKDATETFYLVVPDDADHTVDVTGVDVSDELGFVPPGPAAQPVHRNGSYTFEIPIVNITVK